MACSVKSRKGGGLLVSALPRFLRLHTASAPVLLLVSRKMSGASSSESLAKSSASHSPDAGNSTGCFVLDAYSGIGYTEI